MSELSCRYAGDREQAIVSLIYGDSADFEHDDRLAFEAHLAACDSCRSELAEFESVRAALGRWSPPEPAGLRAGSFSPFRVNGEGEPQPADMLGQAAVGRTGGRVPVWAQTAAALLCLGVAAGIANLDVHYGVDGLRVRTGWSRGGAAAVEVADASNTGGAPEGRTAGTAVERTREDNGGTPDAVPWRAELAALEQRLRADIRQASAAPVSADALRRVQLIVEESERRQQRELALRLGEAMREVNVQRQADLVRIDRNIGAMQSNTGREMLRQRSEMLNYVTVRTASQRGQ
jgi:hypothetical protein